MKALTNWKVAGFKGTIQAVTGFGKSRLGVIAAGEFCRKDATAKWLVLVPTTNLLEQWKLEFIKFGYADVLPQVEFVCYQSAYKFDDKEYDGIVGDEIHVGLSQEYRKVFFKNSFAKILLLTATIDDPDKRAFLMSLAPIVYTMTINKALELGLISDYIMYNLAVPFTKEEQSAYNANQQRYNYYEHLLGGRYHAFDNAKLMLSLDEASKEDKKNATVFYGCIRKRKDLCNNNSNKVRVAARIVQKFPTQYAIFFSESIKPAQDLHEMLPEISMCFHSKMTKKQRTEALKSYMDRRTKIRLISSARALNAGFNVEEASLCISGSGTSKELDQIQRLGRGLRAVENKLARFINLYTPGTQEVKWVTSRSKQFNPKWITSIDEIL